jgi:glycerol-3-phosphate cytidylyltransferase
MSENVLVVGVFDLFHVGHLSLLEKSKALGDKLFIIVNGDKMTTEYKRQPYINENDRKRLIEALDIVDAAVISNEFDIKPYIEEFKITKVVHGDDWEINSYLKQIRCSEEYLTQQNCEIVLVPYTQGISTSELIKEIKLR